MTKYEKIYKNATHIDYWSSEYEIHHKDLNHSNNDITNLLLIPKKLHRRFHNLYNRLNPFFEDISKPQSYGCGLLISGEDLSEYLEIKAALYCFTELKNLLINQNYPVGCQKFLTLDFDEQVKRFDKNLYEQYCKEV